MEGESKYEDSIKDEQEGKSDYGRHLTKEQKKDSSICDIGQDREFSRGGSFTERHEVHISLYKLFLLIFERDAECYISFPIHCLSNMQFIVVRLDLTDIVHCNICAGKWNSFLLLPECTTISSKSAYPLVRQA